MSCLLLFCLSTRARLRRNKTVSAHQRESAGWTERYIDKVAARLLIFGNFHSDNDDGHDDEDDEYCDISVKMAKPFQGEL